MTCPVWDADAAGIAAAAATLGAGGLVAFATETVYGLGADARESAAVARIYAAKGRPSFNPLIVHLPDRAAVERLCDLPPDAARLAAAHWPGPLTLVLRLRAGGPISPLVTAGLDTLAVRVPAHPVALALLRAFGGPVAAPSANPSGRVSPTTAAHVVDGLGDRIDGILDAGPCAVGLESTILDCTGATPALLRAGGVAAEDLAATLGRPLARHAPDAARPSSPGQLASHYAPRGTLRLNATRAAPGEVLLGFGPMECDLNLSPAGALVEAAATLFAHLHRLDALGAARIAVAPVPERGLGRAINDRLRRAAAPRD